LSRNIDSLRRAAAQLRFVAAWILILLLREACRPTTFATISAPLGRPAFGVRGLLCTLKQSRRRQGAKAESRQIRTNYPTNAGYASK
jgi:hypothetical protein